MDANQQDKLSRIKAAKAVAEQARVKRQMDKATAVFSDATSITQVLAYLAGASSVCWSKQPQGEFNSEMASSLVDVAAQRIATLVMDTARQQLEQIRNGDVPAADGLIDYEADDELAERIEREADHA